MANTEAAIVRLRDLLASDPDAMAATGGGGDYEAAAASLARYAASKGISITGAEVEAEFKSRAAEGRAEPLDDAELDKVAGGGSPHCFITVGCFCYNTGP